MAAGLSKTDNFLIDEYIKGAGLPTYCDNSATIVEEFLRFVKSKGYELFDRKSIESLHSK